MPEAEEHEAAGEPEGEQAQGDEVEAAPPQSKHEARVLGGYKATLSSEGLSFAVLMRANGCCREGCF